MKLDFEAFTYEIYTEIARYLDFIWSCCQHKQVPAKVLIPQLYHWMSSINKNLIIHRGRAESRIIYSNLSRARKDLGLLLHRVTKFEKLTKK